MTVLPEQYEVSQLDPKQPVSAYDTFVNALVQEASRPLLVPRNMAIGNSGQYNMASGALDKEDCGEEVLDKDLTSWWFEAVRTPQYFMSEEGGEGILAIVRQYPQLKQEPPDHAYRWDDIPEHTDPVKTAMALNLLHRAGHLSDVDVQERRYNRRTEEHYKNLQKQKEAREELGIAYGETQQENNIGGSNNVENNAALRFGLNGDGSE
jgi:hypothetical protein